MLTVDAPPGAPVGAEQALVHVPPCVDIDKARLVLLFHGSGLQPSVWLDEPVQMGVVADKLLGTGEINQVVLVAPGGADDASFVDTALVPLLNEINAELGGVPTRITTIGFSLGGPTAVRAAVHQDVQADSIVLVASVWRDVLVDVVNDADQANYFAIERVFLDAGTEDGLGNSIPEQTAAFEPFVDSIKIDRPPGSHNVAYLVTRAPEWLTWLDGP